VTWAQSFDEIEKELLNGMKLQGTLTAKEVHTILVKTNVSHVLSRRCESPCVDADGAPPRRGAVSSCPQAVAEFPFFTAVYKISYEGAPPKSIVENLV
jgi:glycerol-3-phosphate dehydrogenase (NAD+)